MQQRRQDRIRLINQIWDGKLKTLKFEFDGK